MMLRAALIGNPNVGKTLIFNNLTGGHHRVGNWPGVTVEKRVGRFRCGGEEVEVVDLPGVYSLTAFSIDQRIALHYILDERPDVVVDIVDAGNLRRNLYLALMLVELEVQLLVALNKVDRARAKGIEIDVKELERLLGVPVVPTVAPREEGMEELKKKIIEVGRAKDWRPPRLDYGPELERKIVEMEELIKDEEPARRYPRRWLAIRLLEGDEEIVRSLGKVILPKAGRGSCHG
jgi:ferrous iron transport protein B